MTHLWAVGASLGKLQRCRQRNGAENRSSGRQLRINDTEMTRFWSFDKHLREKPLKDQHT
jgi:hypothetical protein